MIKLILKSSLAIGLLFNSVLAMANWPPETGQLVPGNGLEYPTKLEAVNVSLQTMLDAGAEIISSYIATDGPVVTIKQHKENTALQYFICVVKGAGTGSDQNIATSKCYAFN